MAVPWGSLPSLSSRPVTVAPAAGLWLSAEQRAARPRPPGHAVLAAGPRLRAAPEEVAGLARLYPAAIIMTAPDSTVVEVLSALDGAAVAHLACHATFRRDNPMFSSLELSDGPLVVHDVERLSRPPAVLVLAACDSGLSETYPGEELLGFLSVLLAAGTESMIASVVAIPDVDTVPLMTALHRCMVAGERPAVALAHARAGLDHSPGAFLAATAFSCFGAG
jgi:CHAT domain-containing protein